ncbi:hypothetical protein L6164_037218 [Bauhinia variegata]|uniref:Uncharacterized protein n=1 Tax=Bauhinia variegata TaxID=167791 RepID=A0ACB9KJH2_BAUVA|nr:hypothetical protein L6164_037218 [Bauhinia variegata]
MVELSPGISSNKFYYDVKFPKGHIALKNFNGEVIDEEGNSVPLYEAYLHHWVLAKYHQPINSTSIDDIVPVRNAGICQGNVLPQYFGLGTETRKTNTYIPDPFGIEIGNPIEIPVGYKEKWAINLHVIDTSGVEDRWGCIECRCDLYNVTRNANSQPLPPGYQGGLQCCIDNAQCRLKEGYMGYNRIVYFKYTIEWIDLLDNFIIPLRIYISDVTDIVKISNNPNGLHVTHNCLDGRVICTSLPKYGKGKEAGNEEGYVVGMTAYYPQPGSVKIMDGETLKMVFNYSNSKSHTRLMGLFHFMVAEQLSFFPTTVREAWVI